MIVLAAFLRAGISLEGRSDVDGHGYCFLSFLIPTELLSRDRMYDEIRHFEFAFPSVLQ